ncbi:DUF2384 domain-containing protein [Permianibacter sp. IMCC34836]|nr:DUF2384 domain-containing protein [Permianibacter fluminis]
MSSTILERISLLTGIQQALLALVPADHAGAWVRQDNPVFHGQQVIQVMISEGNSGMIRVRRYLEAQLNS